MSFCDAFAIELCKGVADAPLELSHLAEVRGSSLRVPFGVHPHYGRVIEGQVDETANDCSHPLRVWEVAVDDRLDELRHRFEHFERDLALQLFAARDVVGDVHPAEPHVNASILALQNTWNPDSG